MLQDNTFHFLGRVSSSVQHTEESQMVCMTLLSNSVHSIYQALLFQYLAFPGGMLKGALAAIGVNCSVGYEITSMPACKCDVNSYSIFLKKFSHLSHAQASSLSQCNLHDVKSWKLHCPYWTASATIIIYTLFLCNQCSF